MAKRKDSIRIDSTSDAILLNRYVAYVTETLYQPAEKREDNIPIKTINRYQIQWQNIRNDLRAFFRNPFAVYPQIAYSLLAFIFIALRRHEEAIYTAFFIGAVDFDSAAETSHSGEPATISWNITIGNNSDRCVIVSVNGLSTPNDPTFDSASTVRIESVGATKSHYYLNPGTGSKTCACGGGNIKVGGAISLYGVDQQEPIGSVSEENGTSSPNDMTIATQEPNSMRIDILGANRDDSTNPTGSLDSGTIRHDAITPQNQFRIGLFGYTNFQATAGSDTHQWTTSAFSRYYLAFEVKSVLDVPTINGAISGGFTTSQSHEVTSGTDKLIIAVANRQGTISNVQYGGVACTKIVGAATAFNESVELWELNSPTVGTANITASFSSGDGRVLYGINLADTNNSVTPDSQSATGSSSNPNLTITTTNANVIIIDAGISEGDYTTAGPEQIVLANIQSASYQNFALSYGEKGNTGTRRVDWSMSSGQRWAHVAIAVPLASSSTLQQEGYRFRDDDGDEDGATWLDSQDTDITRADDLNTRLRMLINATGDPATGQYQLEYREAASETVLNEDNFTSALASFWTVSSGSGAGDFTIVSGELVVGSANDTSSCMWLTTAQSLQGKWMQLKIVDPSNDFAFFISDDVNPATTGDIWDEDNWYRWSIITGQFGVQARKSGGSQTLLQGHDTAPSTPYWVRIKLDGTTIYFDYAETEPTTDDDWTNYYSETWGLGIAASANVYIGMSSWDEPDNGDATVDDFKLVEFAPAGSWAKIDPETVDISRQVAADLDNIEEWEADGETYSSTDLEMLYDGGEQLIGVRFDNLTIPPGSTINSAFIRFIVDASQTGAVAVDIHGEDVDDATQFEIGSGTFDVSGRTKTTATVNWNVGGSGAAENTAVDTSDISAIVQEIVDRGGWVSGNAMVFIFSNPSTTNFREFESYDGEPADAPKIFINYTPPADVILSPSTHIGASGENTTAQLTAPSGKTTSDFTAGRIQDDENPADPVDIGDGGYTELEWCFKVIDGITDGKAYEFRVTRAGVALNTYSVTPKLTVGQAGTTETETFTVDGVVKEIKTTTFTVDGLVKEIKTTTFTVDGIVKEVNTTTFTADGIVKATQTQTFTADGIVKAVQETTFTADGIIKAIQQATFTADGIVKTTQTTTFTADGLVKAIQETTFTVDGIVKQVETQTFTTDGIVKAVQTKDFTADGIVKASIEEVFTVDGVVKATQETTFTADGIVLEQKTTTFTVDGLVKAVQEKTFTADGIVKATLTTTFTTDGVVKATLEKTFTADGLVKQIQEATFTADGIVKETRTTTFTVDGVVKEIQVETFTADGIVQATQSTQFTADGIVFATQEITYTVDGIVQSVETKTFTVDGVIREASHTTFTVDGVVLQQQTTTFTADGLIKEINTAQFTADGIVKSLEIETFTVDGVIQATQEITFSVDGLVLEVKTTTFTVDGLVQATNTNTITLDAVVKASQTNTYTVDGIVKATQVAQVTVDALVKAIFEVTFTADGVVKATQEAEITLDALILATTNKLFTVDGQVRSPFEAISFTVDGIVVQGNLKEFSVDALIIRADTGTLMGHNYVTPKGLVREKGLLVDRYSKLDW